MPFWPIIGVAVIRLFVTLAPFLGLLNKDYEDFNLRGPELEEAKELMEAINSRIILLSWPPLTVMTILARSDQICTGVTPLGVLILFTVMLFLCLIVTRIKSVYFRGILPPLFVLIGTTMLDVLFQIYLLDKTAYSICS